MTTSLTTRTITTLLILLFSTSLSFSQESNNPNNDRAIGITFSSLGENEVFRFEELDGSAGFEGTGFFFVGISYLHQINKWVTIETGAEYAQHTISIQSQLPPDLEEESSEVEMNLITVPLSIRARLSEYFFINTGLLIDIDISDDNQVDSQTGIGGLLGLGANYKFDSGVSIFLSPYLKLHALVPFSNEDYHQRILEVGIRFGVAYYLK